MNNKVLVTGGTGFVGMRIISRLLEQGYEVQTTIRDLSKADKVIKNNARQWHFHRAINVCRSGFITR